MIHPNRYELSEQEQLEKAMKDIDKRETLERAKKELETFRAQQQYEKVRGPFQGTALKGAQLPALGPDVASSDRDPTETQLRREIAHYEKLVRIARLKRDLAYLKRELEELQAVDFG